jgi:hypothetical protein
MKLRAVFNRLYHEGLSARLGGLATWRKTRSRQAAKIATVFG